MNETFHERLSTLVLRAGSVNKLADICGVAQSSLSTAITRNSDMKMPTVVAIAESMGVSLDWLARGVGEAQEGVAEQPGRYKVVSEFAFVPFFSVTASAGYGAAGIDRPSTKKLAYRCEWLESKNLQAANLFALEVVGDSMEPFLYTGDTVLVDGSIQAPETDGVYLLSIEGDLFVKRLQRLIGQGYEIQSDNSAYKSQVIDKQSFSQIKVLGKVVWPQRRS